MQHLHSGYRGLSAFVGLNIDRVLATGAIAGAVLLAGWVQSL